MATYYSSIATEQQPFLNFPGGGPVSNGTGSGFNDPALEIGSVKEVIAYYTMTGSEAQGDKINIYLAQPGSMVDPTYSSVSTNGVGATATLSIGDDDTTGTYLITGASGASATRYASGLDVHASVTSPIGFAGGTSLNNPYQIGALAIEPQGSSAGTGIAGSWVYATFASLVTPTAGQVLVFRLKVVKP